MGPRYWRPPGGPEEAQAMLTATDYKVTRGIERLELQRLIDAGELTQEEADGRQLARDRINEARAAKFGGAGKRLSA